jgi:hypothetical protein
MLFLEQLNFMGGFRVNLFFVSSLGCRTASNVTLIDLLISWLFISD